jgi:drug/metabolite transporter (DMT)-like permease
VTPPRDPVAQQPHIPPRALVLLVVLMLVWGTNWTLFSHAVREVSVWTFRAVALPVSGAALLLVARMRGQSLRLPRQHWRVVLAACLCYLVVWNIASTYAAVMIPSGQAAVLGFTMPLWSTLISWLVLKERITARLLLAVAMGAVAVGLLMWPALGAYAQAPAGFALGLLAAVGWAVGTIVLQRGRVAVPVIVLAGWQMLITAVPIAAGALVLGDHQWFMPSWASIAVIAYIALVPMGIGNAIWFGIVGLLPASVAGLSAIAVPMVAMVTGALVKHEPLGPLQWAAMACCAVALSLVVIKPRKP